MVRPPQLVPVIVPETSIPTVRRGVLRSNGIRCDAKVSRIGQRKQGRRRQGTEVASRHHDHVLDDIVRWRHVAIAVMPRELQQLEHVDCCTNRTGTEGLGNLRLADFRRSHWQIWAGRPLARTVQPRNDTSCCRVLRLRGTADEAQMTRPTRPDCPLRRGNASTITRPEQTARDRQVCTPVALRATRRSPEMDAISVLGAR